MDPPAPWLPTRPYESPADPPPPSRSIRSPHLLRFVRSAPCYPAANAAARSPQCSPVHASGTLPPARSLPPAYVLNSPCPFLFLASRNSMSPPSPFHPTSLPD